MPYCMQSTVYAAVRRFFLPIIAGTPTTPEAMQTYDTLLREQIGILECQLQKTGQAGEGIGCWGAGLQLRWLVGTREVTQHTCCLLRVAGAYLAGDFLSLADLAALPYLLLPAKILGERS